MRWPTEVPTLAVVPFTIASDPAHAREGCHHPARLWLVERNLYAWGHFTVATIGGKEAPHDFRLPFHTSRVPGDAVELPVEAVEAYWHDDTQVQPTWDIAAREARRRHNLRMYMRNWSTMTNRKEP